MAGRYWYLEENKSEEMRQACKNFELFCKNDPLYILNMLKINPESLKDGYAHKRLQELRQDALKHCGYYFRFNQLKGHSEIIYSEARKRQRRLDALKGGLLLLLIGGTILSLLIIGFITVIRYIYNSL